MRDALAQLYAARGNFDASIGEMLGVLERAPDGNLVRFRLAEVYVAKGDIAQGKAELLTCISRAPKWIAPYKRLALPVFGRGEGRFCGCDLRAGIGD